METMQAHVQAMETRFEEWAKRIDSLMGHPDGLDVTARIERAKRLDELKAKHKAARAKLDELKTASVEDWQAFTAAVEGAWTDLDGAFRKLTN